MKKSKKITNYFTIIFGILMFQSCTKIFENESDVTSSIASDFTLMTNSWDPLITRYKDDEVQIDYWGERDANGMPTVINQINVHKKDGKTIFRLDEEGRPRDILAQNGTLIQFDWVSDQKASLTLISADGLEQINTEIDLSENADKSIANNIKQESRIGKSATLNFKELPKTLQPSSNKSIADGIVKINVQSCGTASDARVNVNVKDEFGIFLGNFPTKRLAKGEYYVKLPIGLAPELDLDTLREFAVTALKASCVKNSEVAFAAACLAISAAIAGTVYAAPYAPAFLVACNEMIAGHKLYCIANGPYFTNKLFKKAGLLDRKIKSDILLSASALALPNNVLSETIKVSENEEFPNLHINLASETTIRTLRLNPSTPVSGQDYNALANVFCLYQGTIIKFSVVGTDGYSDQITYPSNANGLVPQPEGEFSLTVPGADSGVRDRITLEVNLPNGENLIRKASLIFN